MRSEYVFRVLLGVAVLVVVYGTLIGNGTPMEQRFPDFDKLEHFTAFGGVAGLARLSFRRVGSWQMLEHVSLMGALIEVAQSAPAIHRDCDWRDWVADTAGAACALLVLALVLRWLGARRPAGPLVI